MLFRSSDESLDAQIETILEITANGGAQGIFHGMSEDDLRTFLVLPDTMIASDAGPRRFGDAVPHPRGYGNNARLLGRYVRDLKLLSLEEGVRKMTSLPARTFRLKNRGELRNGFVADLVLFDPETIARKEEEFVSDFPGEARRYVCHATGIDKVIVNGQVVRDGDAYTNARAGAIV